ncbi:type II secretion system protein [Superficieibacter sp. HKU1]|uniref:type II secretion system protein n=1 Tax=Superficieibacter sp. HKU1 TaxID=3031919 RepID=UPI0023E279ED|nr:type II secretion system protein [Superficieibacter sp. HKU1]WES67883.1 type II secretion system protein [Superficieibacter sp. HKU1]
MRSRKDSGFSLLEIIIVLAIIGGILVSYTYYARKKAVSTARQNVANALVAEMKGVINFAREDKIALVKGSQPKDEDITNPLYDDSSSVDPAYAWRITNEINTVDTGSVNDYFLWGEENSKSKQQRYYFLSSKCNTTLKSEYAFDKEYLPCFMSSKATHSSAVIERIGFAGGTSAEHDRDVNRIDVIVKFKKEEKNGDYQFADFAPNFSDALASSNISATHAIVVHRNATTDNWKLVVKKKDNKTPVELNSVANNMDAVTQYTSGEFGVRFTFDLNDNTNGGGGGGGGGGVACWDSGDVKLCYNKDEGQGEHGEDAILSLDMTDKNNTNNNEMTGTLKANVVMENTSRRVYVFKRTGYGSDFELDKDGNPQRYTYTDKDGKTYEGDFVMDDDSAKDTVPDDPYHTNYEYYTTRTYDAFELLTPATSEYHAFREGGRDVTNDKDYVPSYDDKLAQTDNDFGAIRIPVQSCPQVKQFVTLRDENGDVMLDGEGNPKKVEVVRKLYPRLSASVSSIATYGLNGGTLSDDPSQTRNKLDNSHIVGQLGGVATQIEFTLNNETYRPGSNGINTAEHVIYEDTKYLWIISASVGFYDGNTGSGVTLVNPPTVGYTISRWCSSIPQPGSPADLLDTYQYK